jgi:hypothetical protein
MNTPDIAMVTHMHMSMDKITGSELLQQIPEPFESGMGKVLPVSYFPGGRVGDQNIKAFFPPDAWQQFQNPPVHLILGILVCPRFVTHGTAEPHKTNSLIFKNFPVNTDTAFRRRLLIAVIMIPVDIENRSGKKCGQEGKIMGVKIPTGEDHIDSIQFAFFKKIPKI